MKSKSLIRRKKISKVQLLLFIVAFGFIGVIIWKSFAAPNPNLRGDLNNDNVVNSLDLSLLLSSWGTSNANDDINGDGTVNVLDLSIVLGHWGQTSNATSVASPVPPSSYTIPAGATLVSTTAQLTTALSNHVANIELADGTYDNGTPFQDNAGSHLYAQHLGKAILKSGIVTGGNGSANGSVLQGLAFNISTAAEAFGDGGADAAVNTWGPAGSNTQVLDCTFEGNKVVSMGLYAYNPTGLVAQRDYFHNFLDEGIRASNNNSVAYGGTTPKINSISDISVDGVSEVTPGASNGTAEAGVWVGQPVINGVHRIKVRNVSISGIETVNNSWDTTFSDLDIDMSGPNYSSGVGVYMEHFTLHDIFTNFNIVGSGIGFNAEWDDGILGNAAAHFDTIENGTIDSAGSPVSSTVGIDLDYGTDSTTVNNVTFDNQTFAGITAYQNNREGGGTNVYTNNTYNLPAGVPDISTSHF
jgi:hypothetical protein